MGENLKTTTYNDGTAISLITNHIEWSNLTTGAYCWYENEESNYKTPYGALYNFYSVETNKLCPEGWHVPTDAEWAVLIDYLGGSIVAGGKLKDASTNYWMNPNTGATNETSFGAIPGGSRNNNGTFNGIKSSGNYWSSSEDITGHSLYQILSSNNSNTVKNSSNTRNLAFSVRCIKGENPDLIPLGIELRDPIENKTYTRGGSLPLDATFKSGHGLKRCSITITYNDAGGQAHLIPNKFPFD